MCEVIIKGHVSTSDALKYILKFNIIILRNVWRVIDNIVHRYTWGCIVLTAAISFIVSFVQISKARAERDSYNKTLEQTQMQLDKYKVIYDK